MHVQMAQNWLFQTEGRVPHYQAEFICTGLDKNYLLLSVIYSLQSCKQLHRILIS